MRKFGLSVCLLLAMVFAGTVMSYAADDTLEIVNTYPVDGQQNTTIENMSVKLDFNQDVGSKDNRKSNNKAFTIKDEKGRKVPIRVMYNPKDVKQVMVIADNHDGKNKTEDDTLYTLHISKNFVSDNGTKLGRDTNITFKTMNQKRNTMVYMVMMVVMFGGMFFFTSRSARKAQEVEDIDKEVKVNPYKEAKRTGKSVEEIVAKQEKERAKRAEKAEKARAKREAEEAELAALYEDDDDLPYGHFRVKRPRPIREAGGKTISGRKAEAEARRAQEEKWARQAKKRKKK
ncbi:MAG: hypothetical protein MR269_06935 [Clostridiales bacterium]|nr:hypothetical protein [Clostridiales bacterium]